MNKLLFIFIIASFFGRGQVNPIFPWVNVWRVMPQEACAGDTLRVNFKFDPPQQGTVTNSSFIIKSVNTYSIAWQGNWNYFYTLPKEHWYPLGPGDSCYLIKLIVPHGLTSCSCVTITSSGDPMIFTLNNCLTGIKENELDLKNEPIYYDLMGNRINKKTNELLIEQVGLRRKKVFIEN